MRTLPRRLLLTGTALGLAASGCTWLEKVNPFGERRPTGPMAERPAESYVSEFLGSRDGLELNKAFARIVDPKVRRSIVDLVRSISGDEEAVPVIARLDQPSA